MNRVSLARHMTEPVFETIRTAQKPLTEEERFLGAVGLSTSAIGNVLAGLEPSEASRAANFTSSLFQDCMVIALKVESARRRFGSAISADLHKKGMIQSREALTAPAKLPSSAENHMLLIIAGQSADTITIQMGLNDTPIYGWNEKITADIEALTKRGQGCPARNIPSEFEGTSMPLSEAVWCEYTNWWTSLELV